jgi:hypothetical protein
MTQKQQNLQEEYDLLRETLREDSANAIAKKRGIDVPELLTTKERKRALSRLAELAEKIEAQS